MSAAHRYGVHNGCGDSSRKCTDQERRTPHTRASTALGRKQPSLRPQGPKEETSGSDDPISHACETLSPEFRQRQRALEVAPAAHRGERPIQVRLGDGSGGRSAGISLPGPQGSQRLSNALEEAFDPILLGRPLCDRPVGLVPDLQQSSILSPQVVQPLLSKRIDQRVAHRTARTVAGFAEDTIPVAPWASSRRFLGSNCIHRHGLHYRTCDLRMVVSKPGIHSSSARMCWF